MASSWQLDRNRLNSDHEFAEVLVTAGLLWAYYIPLVLKMAVSAAESVR